MEDVFPTHILWPSPPAHFQTPLLCKHGFSSSPVLPWDLDVIPADRGPAGSPTPHLHIYTLHRQRGPAPQQPPPARKALVVQPHCPHSNRAPLPSMEERGRERAVTSKRRKRAERGSRGMWDREAWRGSGLGGGQPERAAARALGNIMFSWPEAQDMHPARAPPPAKDSRPVPKPGIPGERIRRKGSPAPAPTPGSLPETHIRPSLGSFAPLLARAPPSPPKLYTSAGPVPKS